MSELNVEESSLLHTHKHKWSFSGFASYCICGSCCLCMCVTVLLFFFGMDSLGFAIGVTYSNATCYQTHLMMPLNLWLELYCSITILSLLVTLMVMAIMCYFCIDITCSDSMVSNIFSIIAMCFYIIFMIVANIIGVIELKYQFDHCIKQVPVVCSWVIVLIIIKSFVVCAMTCVIHYGKTKRDGKTRYDAVKHDREYSSY